MRLEEFDATARENLKKADGTMTALDLDTALEHLGVAHAATYIMRFVGAIRESNHDLRVHLFREGVPPYVEQDLQRFGMTKQDIPDLHKEIGKFYAEKGYTTDGLRSDCLDIDCYRSLVRYAQRGCFLDAQERKDLVDVPRINPREGLPKPLISEEATRKVVEFSREHGEDGLEYWLCHAEEHVNKGFMTYPSEIPRSAREKISSYTSALGILFPEERFQQILKVNARNVALDKIRVLQRIERKVFGSYGDDKVRECLGEIATEGEE